MSKLRIITLHKLCPVQANAKRPKAGCTIYNAVQENAKRPRAGCNIRLIKNIKENFSS